MKVLTLAAVLLTACACAGHASGAGRPARPRQGVTAGEATIQLTSAGDFCGVGRALAPLSVAAGDTVRWKIARGCGSDLEITVGNFTRQDFGRRAFPKAEEVLQDVKVGAHEIVATVRAGVEPCLRPSCYFKYDVYAAPKGSAPQSRYTIDDPELQVRPPH